MTIKKTGRLITARYFFMMLSLHLPVAGDRRMFFGLR